MEMMKKIATILIVGLFGGQLGYMLVQHEEMKSLKSKLALQTQQYKISSDSIAARTNELKDAKSKLDNLTKENSELITKINNFTPLFQNAEDNERKVKTLTTENQRLKAISRTTSKKALQYEVSLEKKLEICISQNNQYQDDLKEMTKRLEHFESME